VLTAILSLLVFLMRWGTYLWPLMVTIGDRYRALPMAKAAFENQVKQWGDIMAFSVLLVLPVLLFSLLCQHWFIRGVALTGVGHKR